MSHIVKGIQSPKRIPIGKYIEPRPIYVKIVTAADWVQSNDNYTVTITGVEHGCGTPCWVLGVEEKVNGIFNSILYKSSIDGNGNITIVTPINTTVRISIIGWSFSVENISSV